MNTKWLPNHMCGGKYYQNYTFCPVHREDRDGMNDGRYETYLHKENDKLREQVRELKAKYEPPAPPAPRQPTRIGDREREATAKHLAAAYTHGYLPVDIFQVRVDLAMAAEYAADLPALTADLPTLRQIEPPEPKPEPVPAPAKKRRRCFVRVQFGRAA